MSIIINSTGITVDNTVVTFDDIYNYAVTNNKTYYISKSGSSYYIKGNLTITNNGALHDINKFITGSTTDGCTLNAPNIKLAYGFGCTDKTNSGDFFAYESTINVFGFWGFFSGANHVEVIDCFVDGFGRIEGSNSILKNIIFKHGRFGVLSPKGTIKTMEQLSVYDSTVYYDTSTSSNVSCSLYHNPAYAFDLDIYYGSYDGYTQLAYIETGTIKNTLRLRGSIVKNGYTLHRLGNNVDFYHQFRFNPKILKIDGSPVLGINVTIADNTGTVVFNGNSDQLGILDTWITYYEDIINSTPAIKTPHTITITDGTTTSTTKLYIDRNFEDFPLYFVDTTTTGTGASVDYTVIQGMLDTLKTDICNCPSTTTILNTVNSNSSKLDTINTALGTTATPGSVMYL